MTDHLSAITRRIMLRGGVSVEVIFAATAIISVSATISPAATTGDAKRGASIYRACASCHSLESGLHLTGPSLAELWEEKAAAQADFPRYSQALKSQTFVWDETTLNAWVADPDAFVKGTHMIFRGIKDDQARADLIAFLRIALAPGGAQSVVAKKLLPQEMARGQAPEPLSDAGPEGLVTAVRHCRNSFFVTTADGKERPFWEQNLRLKVDTGATGPTKGQPVLVQSGMQGDRASLVFSEPKQISAFIQDKC
jgi:cytochrome c